MANVLAVSDLHCPFEHPKALSFLEYVYRHFKCSEVVCMGDAEENNSISKYPKDPDGYSAGHEYLETKAHIQQFFKKFPRGRMLTSNHGVRPYKLAFLSGLPLDFMKPYSQLWGYPDTWSIHEQIIIDDILYFHGEPYSGKNGALDALEKNHRSIVIGHLHSFGGVQYVYDKILGKKLFALNTGCLIDPTQYPFKYAKNNKYPATLGCGVIINGIAFFIPLEYGGMK